MNKKGFSFIELLIVIAIVGVISLFGGVYLYRFSRHQELDNVTRLAVTWLRDAQQRAANQTDGHFWGVCFDNRAGGERSRFFISSSPTSTPACQSPPLIQTTLKSYIDFRQPPEGQNKQISFDQVTGQAILAGCPSANASSTIKIGIVNEESASTTIKTFCSGKVDLQ